MRVARVVGALIALLFTGTAVLVGTRHAPEEQALPRPATTLAPFVAPTTTELPSTTTTEAPTTTGPVVTSPPTTRPPAPPTAAPTTAPAPVPQPAPVSSDGYVNAINAQRANAGLGPVVWDGGLASRAQRYAGYLASIGQLVHSDLNQFFAGTPFWALGEILAYGPSSWGPVEFTNLWMNSPSHREQILMPFYTHAGSGIVIDGQGRKWAVIEFGGVR